MERQKLLLGCIADDFTGAGDIASFFVKGGLKTVLISGIPDKGDIPPGTQAVVISLKSRTAPVEKAIEETLEGIRRLGKYGCEKYYIKYCSTFDSTPRGNIGPVLDAVLNELHEEFTILCPSLPVNGRTVKNGILYVNNIPLAESSMKNHPLTPMWDSKISELMKDQSRHPCILLDRACCSQPKEKVKAYLYQEKSKALKDNSRFYVIPDYEDEEDARKIVLIFGDLKVITGGSGLAYFYAAYLSRGASDIHTSEKCRVSGGALIVAGSVSVTTLEQIRDYKEKGLSFYKISVEKLWKRVITPERIWQDIKSEIIEEKGSVLVYCSESPEDVKKGEALGKYEFAGLLEDTLAGVARLAADHGTMRIICAGGETSGAVTKRLGYTNFYIGESISPGIPIMIPCGDKNMRLILKSGNFGETDFFSRALDLTGSCTLDV